MQIVQDRHICLQIGAFTVDCRDKQPDAMTKGKKIRHPKLRMSDIPQKFWKHYNSFKEKKMSLTELATLVGASRPTTYRSIDVAEGRR